MVWQIDCNRNPSILLVSHPSSDFAKFPVSKCSKMYDLNYSNNICDNLWWKNLASVRSKVSMRSAAWTTRDLIWSIPSVMYHIFFILSPSHQLIIVNYDWFFSSVLYFLFCYEFLWISICEQETRIAIHKMYIFKINWYFIYWES